MSSIITCAGHAPLPDAARAKKKSSTPIASDRTTDMGGADKNTKTSHSLWAFLMTARYSCKAPSNYLHPILSCHSFTRWSPSLKCPASRMCTPHRRRLFPYMQLLRKLSDQRWWKEFWRWEHRWWRVCIDISIETCQSLIEPSYITARYSTQGSCQPNVPWCR